MGNWSARLLHPPRVGLSSVVVSWRLRRPEYWKHDPASAYVADFNYGFTRNPWDRVVSLWHHWLEQRRQGVQPTFEEWVLQPNGYLEAGYHSQPTMFWLKDAEWVGHYEKRELHLKELCVFLRRDVPPDNVNPTIRRPYREYFTDVSVRDRVATLYASDIERFEYTYD